MQNLLKTRGFNPGPTLQISQDDNNPFSDGFQTKLQFEQQEKMRQQMMGVTGAAATDASSAPSASAAATAPHAGGAATAAGQGDKSGVSCSENMSFGVS